MTESNMNLSQNTPILDGFRLQYVQLYNWGSWDKNVYTFKLNGFDTLLTGETGSGKSTIVDAITTLLVERSEISYNKAAGAKKHERSLKSYILGNYKTKQESEDSDESTSVSLRKNNFVTIILACFYNQAINKYVTLSQILYIKNDGLQTIDTIFIAEEKKLDINTDLKNLCQNVQELRRSLTKKGITTFRKFKDYRIEFMKLLGISDTQALRLFNQAIAMKQVESISSFVRNYMLSYEDPDVDTLIQNYEDLLIVYNNLVKARSQVSDLEPMLENASSYDKLGEQKAIEKKVFENEAHFFALFKKEPIEKTINKEKQDLDTILYKIKTLQNQNADLETQKDRISAEIIEKGGSRIESINQEIKYVTQQLNLTKRNWDKFILHLSFINLNPCTNNTEFLELKEKINSLKNSLQDEWNAIDELKKELYVQIATKEKELKDLKTDISTLENTKTNIPRAQIEIRERICADLNIDSKQLPFVGELIEVKDEDKEIWQGAIERLLHSYALSMLVPDTLYGKIVNYINQNFLNGKLVYYKISSSKYQYPQVSSKQMLSNSLIRKINIKDDASIFTNYIVSELSDNYDFLCVNSIEEFKNTRRAITAAGQIKYSDVRHEKDDRKKVSDRRNYVLGWSNQAKIDYLKSVLSSKLEGLNAINDKYKSINNKSQQINNNLRTIEFVAQVESFDEIDYQSLENKITFLTSEIEKIKNTNTSLQELEAKREEIIANLKKNKDKENDCLTKQGAIETNIKQYEAELKLATSLFINKEEIDNYQEIFNRFNIVKDLCINQTAKGNSAYNFYSRNLFDNLENNIKKLLIKNIEKLDVKIDELKEKILEKMNNFNTSYPDDTIEINPSLNYINDYRRLYEQIKQEDLPRFVDSFKSKLQNNTISHIASLIAKLERQSDDILNKVEIINNSMKDIDFNYNTYIELVAIDSKDQDIKQFRKDLSECVSQSIGQEDNLEQAEEKFEKIKKIIEVLKAREDANNISSLYKKKVTDVRNWFNFAANERNREDDKVENFYKDSDGKSGGQKEKLAYTILATSLAFQYGSKVSALNSLRSFRFVVLDEAFSSGSNESAEFALCLFNRLNLQLLCITPRQKIDIIEKYVKSVGYVTNINNRSNITNLTIEEYRYYKEQKVKQEKAALSPLKLKEIGSVEKTQVVQIS